MDVEDGIELEKMVPQQTPKEKIVTLDTPDGEDAPDGGNPSKPYKKMDSTVSTISYSEHYTCSPPKLFIIFITLLQILIFILA